MWSDLPLVISLILTPITSSYAQHTQETLASFPLPECSRHMLLPWNIYHAAPFLQNVFLSHISTYLFSHLFQVLVICFHLDLPVSYWNLLCPQIHTRYFPLGSTFFLIALSSLNILYNLLILFTIYVLYLFTKTQDSQEVLFTDSTAIDPGKKNPCPGALTIYLWWGVWLTYTHKPHSRPNSRYTWLQNSLPKQPLQAF